METQRYRERLIYDEAMKEAQTYNDYVKLETYLVHLEGLLVKQVGEIKEGASNWFATARVIASRQNLINERIRFLVNRQ